MNIETSLIGASLLVPVAVLTFASAAVFTDVKSRKIPNWLTVSSFVAALVVHSITGGWGGLLSSLCGFATGFAILLTLFLIGGGGGGDVKLMGAVGAWVGVWPTLLIFVSSAVFVILIMVGVVLRHGPTAKTSAEESIMKLTLPYAVPVGLALVLVLIIDSMGSV